MKNKKMVKNKNSRKDKSNPIRLNRFLALAGIGSRRKCDEFIQQGKIEVNGKQVIHMAFLVDPENDIVKFKGKVLQPRKQFTYILMNKPLHYVCTVSDEKGRRTVIDLVKIPERLYPVGRLDFNTTGVLLITNDGDLTYYLIHPRFEVKKIYHALLDKRLSAIDLHHFQTGIVLNDFKTSACKIKEIRVLNNCSYVEIEMHEGKNRQIRRMFQELGYQVDKLDRVEFAGLKVGDLKPGEWRELSFDEVKKVKKIVEYQKGKVLENKPIE
jgi:23S rRNA pseudouridine2605 synthase